MQTFIKIVLAGQVTKQRSTQSLEFGVDYSDRSVNLLTLESNFQLFAASYIIFCKELNSSSCPILIFLFVSCEIELKSKTLLFKIKDITFHVYDEMRNHVHFPNNPSLFVAKDFCKSYYIFLSEQHQVDKLSKIWIFRQIPNI